MLREIRVYGRLAKLLKRRVFKAEIGNVKEAIRFLIANFPWLEKEIAQGHYRVSVGEQTLGQDELDFPVGMLSPLCIVPVFAGAGAVGRVIAGAALLVASFAIPGFAAWAGPTAFGLITGVGASLVLGGVAQLLTPTPNIASMGAGNVGNYSSSTRETELDPQKSYSFSGIQNTSSQGTPVPICYGEVITGSVVISVGIDTVQVEA
jgi:predicted phage tail protein